MKNLRAGITAAAATAALGLGGVALAATATASNPHTTTSTPCATEQTQLNRAEAKLASLDAKLAAVAAKVKQDKGALHGSTKGQAKKALARDKAKRAGLLKAKKAQQQRVKHDQTRLAACTAAHPSATASATATHS